MSTEILQMEQNSMTFWSSAFSVSAQQRLRSEALPEHLVVHRDDVLTARLMVTVGFCKAIESGQTKAISPTVGDLARLLDFFCVLATFDNLARARFGDLRKPGFWVRSTTQRGKVLPAIPAETAAKLCGVDVNYLRTCLVPLIKDGAVEFLRSPDGVVAIVVHPGFVNDKPFKKYYQI